MKPVVEFLSASELTVAHGEDQGASGLGSITEGAVHCFREPIAVFIFKRQHRFDL